MKTGVKVGKIARRLQVAPTFKTAKVLSRRPNPPGMHGGGRGRQRSMYGKQLIEKQKLRFQFMITEKVLRRAFKMASRMEGRTGSNLIERLDRRLDSTIFRAGVVRSMSAARQLITHRHVIVNGIRVDKPSYLTSPGDIILFTEKAMKFDFLMEGFKNATSELPYLDLKKEEMQIIRIRGGERSEIPVDCQEQMVVEWYSR